MSKSSLRVSRRRLVQRDERVGQKVPGSRHLAGNAIQSFRQTPTTAVANGETPIHMAVQSLYPVVVVTHSGLRLRSVTRLALSCCLSRRTIIRSAGPAGKPEYCRFCPEGAGREVPSGLLPKGQHLAGGSSPSRFRAHSPVIRWPVTHFPQISPHSLPLLDSLTLRLKPSPVLLLWARHHV